MSPFNNKSILLIAPEFYGYHLELALALKKKGGKVTFFSEMKQSLLYRLSQKSSKKLQVRLEEQHLEKLVSISKAQKYDVVLVVRGGYLTPSIMQTLRTNLKSAKFIMYQWDSYLQNDYRDIIQYFDSVSTFDRDDSQELNLQYEPLFYSDIYRNVALSTPEKVYDLVFYGAYHSDRLSVIKHFDEFFKRNGLTFKIHLYIKKFPLFIRLLNGEIKLKDLKFFRTYSVSSSDISQDYAKSKAVLDIELSIQSGLSIRTFEVLGSGLKLVTTNENIMLEEFYDAEQIMVIDRTKIDVNTSFFTPNKNVIDMSIYHVDSWLDRLFNITNENDR